MTFPLSRSTLFLVILALSASTCDRPIRAEDETSSARINDAIERGAEYLLSELEAAQSTLEGVNGVGQVALETYALVTTGLDLEHPRVRANFDYLREAAIPSKHTYTLSCYILALDAAISQLEQDLVLLAPKAKQARIVGNPRLGREYRDELHQATELLLRVGHEVGEHAGAWSYRRQDRRQDHSNTQFAVLALGVAAKRGAKIPRKRWAMILEHFASAQEKDGPKTDRRITLETDDENDGQSLAELTGNGGKRRKRKTGTTGVRKKPKWPDPVAGTEDMDVEQRGWGYTADKGGTWNMTCAGLSSLLIVREVVGRQLRPAERSQLNDAIRDGYGWLLGHWNPIRNDFYGFYSLEKAADLGRVEKFGDEDWYEQVSSHLVSKQRDDGSWTSRGHGETDHPRVSTAFALLVLERATAGGLSQAGRTRVVYSGGLDAASRNREWVYLRDLDKAVHWPTLIHNSALRPRSLLALTLELVESYPLAWRGELLPKLLEARERSVFPAAQRAFDRVIATATGLEEASPEEAAAWYERWERCSLAGVDDPQSARGDAKGDDEDDDPEGSDEDLEDEGSDAEKGHVVEAADAAYLLESASSSHASAPLEAQILEAAIRLDADALGPLAVSRLRSDSVELRTVAYRCLCYFHGRSVPRFDPDASSRLRGEQVASIEAWLAER